jgi:hypothetical protein
LRRARLPLGVNWEQDAMRDHRDLHVSCIGMGGFGFVFAPLFAWYVWIPGDQLILIGLITLPSSVVMFALTGWVPAIGELLLHLPFQMTVLFVLGCLQYGGVALLVARLFRR